MDASRSISRAARGQNRDTGGRLPPSRLRGLDPSFWELNGRAVSKLDQVDLAADGALELPCLSLGFDFPNTDHLSHRTRTPHWLRAYLDPYGIPPSELCHRLLSGYWLIGSHGVPSGLVTPGTWP